MEAVWTSRLKTIREQLGYSQRELADKLGISGTAWQNYESGKSVPGGSVLFALFELGIDMHWLFTGDGTMYRNQPRPETEAEAEPEPAQRAVGLGFVQKQLQSTFLKNIGLLEVAPLATLGEAMTEYEVMMTLIQRHPNALTLNELQRGLLQRGVDLDERSLLAFLHLLMRRGILKMAGMAEQRFRLVDRTSLLVAEGLSAHAQVAIQAVKMILREALPKSDISPKDGRIMLLRFFADETDAEEYVSELHRMILSHYKSKDRDQGPVELSLVLAVARSASNSG